MPSWHQAQSSSYSTISSRNSVDTDCSNGGIASSRGPAGWGAVSVRSYPHIWRLEFVDAALTRAVARTGINGNEGESVVLEKRAATWTIVRTADRWIS